MFGNQIITRIFIKTNVRNTCLCAIQNRIMVHELQLYSIAVKPGLIEEFMKNKPNKAVKKSTVQTLEMLFKIKKFDAISVASKYKGLYRVMTNTLIENYNVCKDKGVDNEIILTYPDVLADAQLVNKLELLEGTHLNLNDIFPLMRLNLSKLASFVATKAGGVTFQDRIKYMAHVFKKPERIICEHLSKKVFLHHMNLKNLENKVMVLKDSKYTSVMENYVIEFGIKEDELTNDLWVLRYSEKVIRERLETTKNRNVETVKTWMVRAPSIVVDRYVKRRSDNKLILGNHSLVEYLSERLDCSIPHAKYLISKHPALESKSLTKMQEIIDLLYSRGFKPFHLCRVPKILLHSAETTSKRLKEIESQGVQLDSLHILTKSQKQYMQYYDGLVKANKTKNKK